MNWVKPIFPLCPCVGKEGGVPHSSITTPKAPYCTSCQSSLPAPIAHLKLFAQAVQLPLPRLRGLLEAGGQQAVENAKEAGQGAAHCRHLLLAAYSVTGH